MGRHCKSVSTLSMLVVSKVGCAKGSFGLRGRRSAAGAALLQQFGQGSPTPLRQFGRESELPAKMVEPDLQHGRGCVLKIFFTDKGAQSKKFGDHCSKAICIC